MIKNLVEIFLIPNQIDHPYFVINLISSTMFDIQINHWFCSPTVFSFIQSSASLMSPMPVLTRAVATT